MAQSRLEKIGTIFTRVTGLLRSGAMKPEDKPIWYDVYAAFPPKLEPRYDRPAPNMPVRQIFYEEDVIRAKFHKANQHLDMINMSDAKRETQTQQFIKIYRRLQDQGALDEQQIFETANDLLNESRTKSRLESTDLEVADSRETESFEAALSKAAPSLSESFVEAKSQRSEVNAEKDETSRPKKPNAAKAINIENLFKD